MEKNKYEKYGLSVTMGIELRHLVERQLSHELNNLLGIDTIYDFDWSESCIEGHNGKYLDGNLENYSGIKVSNNHMGISAEGWMDFIQESDFFLAYWDQIIVWKGREELLTKHFGISDFAFSLVPDILKWHFK